MMVRALVSYLPPDVQPIMQTSSQGRVLLLQTVSCDEIVPQISSFPVRPDPTTRPRLRRKEGCDARINLVLSIQNIQFYAMFNDDQVQFIERTTRQDTHFQMF